MPIIMVCLWFMDAIMQCCNENLMPVLREIGQYLTNTGQTIAIAESVTSGLVQWYLSMVQGASQFFQGGITAYNLGQKYRHLQVEPIHAAKVDCVSKLVAGEMAVHCNQLFHSSWAIAITGYATPVAASGNKVFAWWAIALGQRIIADGLLEPSGGDPQALQQLFAETALTQFRDALSKDPPPAALPDHNTFFNLPR